MSIDGTWDLTIATPIGRIAAVVDLAHEGDRLVGVARGSGEEVPLTDITLDGDELRWKQAITKPLRLNLTFSVVVTGDTLAGTSKAGRLPASKVTGRRQ